MDYDAFISYSHAGDGRLAPAVQAGLQRLTKPWWKLRALHVFRDETGLAVDPHMWNSIRSALDGSAWFVLLASPEAAASRWVNKEIEHWLASKPAERILPVVTGGIIDWDYDANDFSAHSNAIPPALRSAYEEEPRYLDLRWARSEDDLDLRHPRFKTSLATLAAPIHGVAPERLETEDVRAHRRARRVARVAAAALVLLTFTSIASTTVAWHYVSRARADARFEIRASACNSTVDAVRAAAAAYYASSNPSRFPRTFAALAAEKPPVIVLPKGVTIAVGGVTGMPKGSYSDLSKPIPVVSKGATVVGVFDARGQVTGYFTTPKPITRAPKGATVTLDFLSTKYWSVTMSGGGSTAPTFECNFGT